MGSHPATSYGLDRSVCRNCGGPIICDSLGWFHVRAEDGKPCAAKPGGAATGQGDLFAKESA